MTDWQPIETAPLDGSIVLLRVAGKAYPCAATDGYRNSDDEDCWAWEHRPDDILADDPPGWCGGTCWQVNDDGVPSVQPDAWMPLPPPPAAEEGEG